MWVLLIGSAFAAAPCDAKALQASFTDISPTAAGERFVELAGCDPVAAKAFAPEAFQKVIAGNGGDAAVVAAIKLGAGETVRNWLLGLEPDDRGPTLSKLGDTCETPEVPGFFVESEKALTDRFYSGRWWAALDSCRAPAVQALLNRALTERRKDRTLYGGLLDVYARNLGAKAIPALAAMVKAETDPLVIIDIVDSFPDAAGVGDAAGANPEVVLAAATALKEASPNLPEKAADQARKALLSLNDELAADQLVTVRFKSLLQPDGSLLYGVLGVEVATCKKGDTRIDVHHAMLRDSGHTWPDQLAERAEGGARSAFGFKLGEQCRGTSEVSFQWSETPFKDAAAFNKWLGDQMDRVRVGHPGVDVKVYPAAPLQL